MTECLLCIYGLHMHDNGRFFLKNLTLQYVHVMCATASKHTSILLAPIAPAVRCLLMLAPVNRSYNGPHKFETSLTDPRSTCEAACMLAGSTGYGNSNHETCMDVIMLGMI